MLGLAGIRLVEEELLLLEQGLLLPPEGIIHNILDELTNNLSKLNISNTKTIKILTMDIGKK